MAGSSLENQVKELILSGQLKRGERVTEAGLAESLGVSRTPIRNILPALAAEGLLEPVGKRGFRVREFSDQDSFESIQLRAALEGLAARRLAELGPSEKLVAELLECLEEGDRIFEKRHLDLEDETAYGKMNQRFHDLIVKNCGSQTLIEFVDRLNLVPFVAPSVIVFDHIGLRKAFDLLFRAHGVHHAIVDAIVNGDGMRAELLFREHANQQQYSMFSRKTRKRLIGSA